MFLSLSLLCCISLRLYLSCETRSPSLAYDRPLRAMKSLLFTRTRSHFASATRCFASISSRVSRFRAQVLFAPEISTPVSGFLTHTYTSHPRTHLRTPASGLNFAQPIAVPSQSSLVVSHHHPTSSPCSRLSLSSRHVSSCPRPSLFSLTHRGLHSPRSRILSREPCLYMSSCALTSASRRTPVEPSLLFSLRRHIPTHTLSLTKLHYFSLSQACCRAHHTSHLVSSIFCALFHL